MQGILLLHCCAFEDARWGQYLTHGLPKARLFLPSTGV